MPATAVRITVKRGRLKRVFVLEKPPFPRIGDSVRIKGEGGAEWFVAKVAACEPVFFVDFTGGRVQSEIP